jgi:hypothetical protein
LRIYDPNQDAADTVTLSLSLSKPTEKTSIEHNIAIDHGVRGFFRTTYTWRDPAHAVAVV